MGNILRMVHRAIDAGSGQNDWVRHYAYEDTSNRLLATTVGVAGEDPNDPSTFGGTYTHDAHGNMTSMPHLPVLQWDHRDRLFRVERPDGGEAFYHYDSAGERVRKVVRNAAGTQSQERVYLGPFELYRERTGATVELERETLHISDDTGRIAMVETKTVDGGSSVATPVMKSRFQYGNHLGSVALEVDDAGAVISYEEYHPFGTSSVRAADASIDVSAKRYRYIGKERDEETGLYYCSARYYACWLGRWTRPDPAGLVDGPGVYNYSRNNPVRLSDPGGRLAGEPDFVFEDEPVQGNVFATGEVREGETRREFAGRVVQQRFAGIDPTERSVVEQELPEGAGIAEEDFVPGAKGSVLIPPEKVAEFGRRFEATPRAQGERLAPGLVEGKATGEVDPQLATAAEIAAIGLKAVEGGLALLGLGALVKGGLKIAGERALAKGAERGLIAEETAAISGTARLAGGGQAAGATVAPEVARTAEAGESVPLFRAVEPAELADIQAREAFRNPFGIEVKFFSTTLEGAAQEARGLSRLTGGKPFTLVETAIPRNRLRLLPEGNTLQVDTGVPTVVLPTEFLPALSRPRALNFAPIPRRRP